MRPISKFGFLLAIAAVLALLFAALPQPRGDKKLPKSNISHGQTGSSARKEAQHSPSAVAATEFDKVTSVEVWTSPAPRLNFPAVRGLNNYGWVQLPHGTPVEFVRQNGRDLWIRWDGTLVKIDASLAACGAVVLRPSTPLNSQG